MATTLYKIQGSKVTAEEAAAAASALQIDAGYEFVGWSSTSGSTAIVDFSNGVVINEDTTFYPVEKPADLFKKISQEDSLWYFYTPQDTTDTVSNGLPTTGVNTLNADVIKPYMHIGFIIGRKYYGGEPTTDDFKDTFLDVIDFGMIKGLNGVTTAASFSKKSEKTNITYYFKVEKSGNDLTFALFALYDTIFSNYLTNQCGTASFLEGYSEGDLIPIELNSGIFGANNSVIAYQGEQQLYYLAYEYGDISEKG